MEKSNENSVKKHSAQEVNEGFSGKNVSKIPLEKTPDLKKEVEKDNDGSVENVDRARYADKNSEEKKFYPKTDSPTESIHQTPETAEHKDLNSNPNPEEYPDKNRQNADNNGNMDN